MPSKRNTIAKSTWQRMERSARAAAAHSYSPYSKFRVGAAVLASSGKIYAGCNVENVSYGLTNCAERTAVFSAVTAGETRISAVLIYTPTKEPTPPCGACRQVLAEFGSNIEIVSICDGEARLHTNISDLLPSVFDSQKLSASKAR